MVIISYFYYIKRLLYLIHVGIGDWGLGIGQPPIPNPQSPIMKNNKLNIVIIPIK